MPKKTKTLPQTFDKSDVRKWCIEGMLLEPPKPKYMSGMPRALIIVAYNGTDLFIEENGEYRVSTEREYELLKSSKISLKDIAYSRRSPFPRKRKDSTK